jgi:hypothetical protein
MGKYYWNIIQKIIELNLNSNSVLIVVWQVIMRGQDLNLPFRLYLNRSNSINSPYDDPID